MSLNACILIKTTPLHTGEVLQKTRGMKEVRKAFVAYGRVRPSNIRKLFRLFWSEESHQRDKQS